MTILKKDSERSFCNKDKQTAHMVYDETNNRLINMRCDPNTWAAISILYPHYKVHNSEAFGVFDVQNVATATQKWQFQTPNSSNRVHMLFDIDATGEITLLITEGSDRTGTTLLTPINRNRNATNTSDSIVHRGVSDGSTDGATTIFHLRTGSTGLAAKTIAVGGARDANEFILKENTKYVISVTTYADVYVSLNLDWYEHVNK